MYTHHDNPYVERGFGKPTTKKEFIPTLPTVKVPKKKDDKDDVDLALQQAEKAKNRSTQGAETVEEEKIEKAKKAFDDEIADFIPADKFTKSRPGYVFKMDWKGLGYYLDGLKPPVEKARAGPQPTRSVGDWTELRAPDGRLYYFNDKTNVTQWNVPQEFEEIEKQAPKSHNGWTEYTTHNDKRYYHNSTVTPRLSSIVMSSCRIFTRQTGETTWVPPKGWPY
mmetsp:Transcript_6160/g.21779  ORF Transcript_6160/g.21779 Transcript_6160/m.21779 type:complete len:223 (-) Transcript_6160:1541-2209(-)